MTFGTTEPSPEQAPSALITPFRRRKKLLNSYNNTSKTLLRKDRHSQIHPPDRKCAPLHHGTQN
jgi:hypothetical protein